MQMFDDGTFSIDGTTRFGGKEFARLMRVSECQPERMSLVASVLAAPSAPSSIDEIVNDPFRYHFSPASYPLEADLHSPEFVRLREKLVKAHASMLGSSSHEAFRAGKPLWLQLLRTAERGVIRCATTALRSSGSRTADGEFTVYGTTANPCDPRHMPASHQALLLAALRFCVKANPEAWSLIEFRCTRIVEKFKLDGDNLLRDGAAARHLRTHFMTSDPEANLSYVYAYHVRSRIPLGLTSDEAYFSTSPTVYNNNVVSPVMPEADLWEVWLSKSSPEAAAFLPAWEKEMARIMPEVKWKRILRKKERGEKLTAEEASFHRKRMRDLKERAKKREEGMRMTDALLRPRPKK